MANSSFESFGAFGALFALGAAVVLVLFLIGVGLYVLGAYGLYSMGSRRGIQLSWLAFIPIAQLYVVGLLLKDLRIWGIQIPRPEIALPVAQLVMILVREIPLISFLISLAGLILLIGALYYLYKQYKGRDTAILYTILSVILPFLLPIFLFTLRNTSPIENDSY